MSVLAFFFFFFFVTISLSPCLSPWQHQSSFTESMVLLNHRETGNDERLDINGPSDQAVQTMCDDHKHSRLVPDSPHGYGAWCRWRLTNCKNKPQLTSFSIWLGQALMSVARWLAALCAHFLDGRELHGCPHGDRVKMSPPGQPCVIDQIGYDGIICICSRERTAQPTAKGENE